MFYLYDFLDEGLNWSHRIFFNALGLREYTLFPQHQSIGEDPGISSDLSSSMRKPSWLEMLDMHNHINCGNIYIFCYRWGVRLKPETTSKDKHTSLISYKLSMMACFSFPVDVRGLESLDSMPNLIMSGAARSKQIIRQVTVIFHTRWKHTIYSIPILVGGPESMNKKAIRNYPIMEMKYLPSAPE